jgi:Tfp pilus assembly protein PilO
MKTKNLAVGALAAVLTLALWWNFLVKPTRAEQKKVKAETAAEQTKLQPLQAQLAQARLDASHAATMKARLAALQRALPTTPALANFIRDANGIAAASNVSWQAVTHGPPVPGDAGIGVITVGIQLRGTYEQVMDYLGRIAGLHRLLVLDSVQFAASAGTTAAAGTAAAAGTDAAPGASTGPYSGASELAITITARMFESVPAAVQVTGSAAA